MDVDIPVKSEPIESLPLPHSRLLFVCEPCDIRFSNRNTLDAHRQHYCPKRQTTSRHPTDLAISSVAQSMKRKFADISETSSTKRLSLLSHDSYCQECHVLADNGQPLLPHQSRRCPRHLSDSNLRNRSVSFNRPVQLGKFIYVPIPIRPTPVDTATPDSKPLDLSKSKQNHSDYRRSLVPPNSPVNLSLERSKRTAHEQLHRCEFCAVHFRSLKTLRAHQGNYCGEYRQQRRDESNQVSNMTRRSHSSAAFLSESLPNVSTTAVPRPTLFICRVCQYRGNTLRGMRMHFKFHVSNHEPCSDEDIIIKSTATSSELPVATTHSLLKCTICSAMFDHEETLFNHIRSVHTHERFLKCLECQSRFCSKWNLIRHMKFTHTNVKYDQHEPSASRNLPVLQLEMRSTAENWPAEKTFSCPLCHSAFRDIEMLKQHVIGYCPAQTSTQDIFNEIRRKIANETFCSLCQISFQYKTSYDAHRLYYCPGGNVPSRTKLLA